MCDSYDVAVTIAVRLMEAAVLPKPEKACFVIADISGYTKFLASAELEHAQDIIADFMDTTVESLRPPFRLAKFEGDAAFVYAVKDELDASLLQDTIESAYFAFRRRMRDVKQASACTCNACISMSDLDFKFVVHYGEMVKQTMGGREELAGRDVILVHRLLKKLGERKPRPQCLRAL
jgi:class 3 adenylate cyclase